MSKIKKFESFKLKSKNIKPSDLNSKSIEYIKDRAKDSFLYISDDYNLNEPDVYIYIVDSDGSLHHANDEDEISKNRRILGDKYESCMVSVDLEFDGLNLNSSSFTNSAWCDYISADHMIKLLNDCKEIAKKTFNGIIYYRIEKNTFYLSILIPNE